MLAVGNVWSDALACSPEGLEDSRVQPRALQGVEAVVDQVETRKVRSQAYGALRPPSRGWGASGAPG